MKRIDKALAIGLLATVLLTSFTSFARDCDEVRGGVVRLHILANSDSEADQSLKLAVRDEILRRTEDMFSSQSTKEQVENALTERLPFIEQVAREEISRQGYGYPVKAELVNMYFETRTYGGVTMPAGRYDAVRVNIGEAEGRNWWCVLFPPMCVPAASEALLIEQQIEHLGSQPRYVPKFALVEWIESVSNTTE